MGNSTATLHQSNSNSNFGSTSNILLPDALNSLSIRSILKNQGNAVPEGKAWDVVFNGNVSSWLPVAGQFGLTGHQVVCTSSQFCDRDYVCHCYFSVFHRRWKKVLRIIRFKGPSLSIPIGKHPRMGKLLSACLGKMMLVVAVRKHLAVLEMAIGERRHAFPILDTDLKAVVAVYEPDFLLTLVEGEISPDLSRTGLLLYSSSQDPNGHFSFDLFLICNRTGELLSCTCLGMGGIQPHFAFHPSYQWSHIVATQYSKDGRKLAILNLVDEKCVCLSSPTLAFIVGHHQLFPSFSPDGRFLFLQKLSDDRFGVTSFCDTYIFNVSENTFHLIKYISSKIPGIFHSCNVWYKPAFSLCGQYLRLLNSVKTGTSVVVYKMPNVLGLKCRSRQVIMSCLQSTEFVEQLPLPNRLKEFLIFTPFLNDNNT